jgi:hypothetical protein
MAEEIEMFGVREVFQLLEDALLSAGWNDIVMATDHGLFTWKLGRFPDRFVIQRQDGSVVLYRGGIYQRYSSEQWEAVRATFKD